MKPKMIEFPGGDPLASEAATVWEQVRDATSIVITTHIDPDGDAIGSILAFYHVACAMGKDPLMVCRDPAPSHLKFLPGSDLVFSPAHDTAMYRRPIDLLVVLDCSDPVRLGESAALMENAECLLVIDHHSDAKTILGQHIVDERASSTGEILYRLMLSGGVDITPEAALALYVAIMTDTGSFRYGNTSAQSFRIASELVRTGSIDVRSIGVHIFARDTLSRLKLRGQVYERTRIDGTLIYSFLTPAMIESSGSNRTEAEGIVDDLALCHEAEVAAILWLQPDGVVRVQLRSIKEYDVLSIAQDLGGGGHHKSAGCRIRGVTVDEALERVRDAVLRHIRPSAFAGR